MKRLHIDSAAFARNLPLPSPAFSADILTQLRELAAREEEPPMKRKAFSTVVIAALILALLAASALAAYTIVRSKQADAVSRARKALAAEYGLTPETFGLFYTVSEQNGETWTISFYAEGFYPPLLGDYTVTLAQGRDPQTSWTYDGVDPDLWRDGSLDAPVWGQPQMLAALRDKEAAANVMAGTDWGEVQPRRTPPPDMDALKEGESIWQDQILRKAAPGPGDLSQAEAMGLARQAVMEEASPAREALDAADTLVDFYTRDTGNPIWGFSFQFTDNGVFQDWGVMVDARTGEILLIGVITGGNG